MTTSSRKDESVVILWKWHAHLSWVHFVLCLLYWVHDNLKNVAALLLRDGGTYLSRRGNWSFPFFCSCTNPIQINVVGISSPPHGLVPTKIFDIPASLLLLQYHYYDGKPRNVNEASSQRQMCLCMCVAYVLEEQRPCFTLGSKSLWILISILNNFTVFSGFFHSLNT